MGKWTWCSSCVSGSPGRGPGWGWWSGHRSHTAPWRSSLTTARSAALPPGWHHYTLQEPQSCVSLRIVQPAARPAALWTYCGCICGCVGGSCCGAATSAAVAGSESGSPVDRCWSTCSRGVCHLIPCSWIRPATSCPQAPCSSFI